MKKDYFGDMFTRAINWDKVEENAEAIASILCKDNEKEEGQA